MALCLLNFVSSSFFVVNWSLRRSLAPSGIGIATSTLIGNALGAGKPEEAKLFARLGMIVECVYGLINGSRPLTASHMLSSIRGSFQHVFTPPVYVLRVS